MTKGGPAQGWQEVSVDRTGYGVVSYAALAISMLIGVIL
jgi:hypothetical protein